MKLAVAICLVFAFTTSAHADAPKKPEPVEGPPPPDVAKKPNPKGDPKPTPKVDRARDAKKNTPPAPKDPPPAKK